jgi:two-component system NtrC family response regulator
METVLIVDDEKNYPPVISAVLQEEGYETLMANSGQEALDLLRQNEVALVLTDMKMPVMDGMALLEKIKAIDPELPVMMMTAFGTVEKAVEAMQKGAYNYILKPFDNQQLIAYVKRAVVHYRIVRENRSLRNAFRERYSFGNIIGKSKPMQAVFEMIRKVAPANASVLIEGESGTGKELVAKSIHYNSPRRDKPFIAVNCSALAETLLESELFGHEKGAFTGAVASKKGRFELAGGGTLFLDEIGELSPNLQVKLLRVLQEKRIERVGGVQSLDVDIRLLAATNKDLKKEIAAGHFREDLYYRLNVVYIGMPPLRARSEDIPLLVQHFIKKYAGERTVAEAVTGIDQDVARLFYDYPWPGNVRELENVIERAIILAPQALIQVSDLPREFRQNAHQSLDLKDIPQNAQLYDTLAMVERMMIQRALRLSGNVQARAAELLGIGKSGLNQKIKKYGLDIGGKR